MTDLRRALIPLEFALGLMVVAMVAVLMRPLGGLIDSGDGRFNKEVLQSVSLPAPVLPELCLAHGGLVAAPLAGLCERHGFGTVPIPKRTPVAQVQQFSALRLAFTTPIAPQVTSLRALEVQQLEGLAAAGADSLNEQIAAQRQVLQPYLQAYGIEGDSAAGPLALQCLERVQGELTSETGDAVGQAGAQIWLGAQLDGVRQPFDLDDTSFKTLEQAWRAVGTSGLCRGFDDVQGVGLRLSQSVALARTNADEWHKAGLMRDLLRNAWWQWSLWVLCTLLLVSLYRRAVPENRWAQTGAVLLVWTGLGWLSQVWLPFPEGVNRLWLVPWLNLPIALPPWPLMGLAVLGACLWIGGLHFQRHAYVGHALSQQPVRQVASSRLAFALVLLLIGLGWLLILDLSATGPLKNRYLGLYHQGTVWLGLGLIVLSTLWRQWLGLALLRSFGLLSRVVNRVAVRMHRAELVPVVFVMGFAAVFYLLQGNRQLTSELGRVWLIVAAAWFFYFSGDLTLKLTARQHLRSSVRFMRPLFVILLALVAAMAVTDDMGPLLITAYSGGLFLAAAISYIWQQRGMSPLVGNSIGLLVLLVWFSLLTQAVFGLGHLHATTAVRLESVYLPLASSNDQMGVISWFRAATPMFGFGVGQVPWCGFASGDQCHGVPLQIHSDYTVSAVWGLFGPVGAIAFVLLSLLLVFRVIVRHSRVTTGLQTTLHHGTAICLSAQPVLSWVCVTWLVLLACQMAVTVAGNLRVLPLTGVTYPFVSLGKWSMFVNVFLMGLAMTVDVHRAPAEKVTSHE